MQKLRIVLCILGAMIGAGFSSGREIMYFFSRYGRFSWILIMLSGMMMMYLMYRMMSGVNTIAFQRLHHKERIRFSSLFFLLILAAAGGGMTAAAGELAGLVGPIHHAKEMGMLCTLGICMAVMRCSMDVLSFLGKLLLPLLLIAFLLCMRLPSADPVDTCIGMDRIALAVLQAGGYAGMNVMLASGILCEAGESCGKKGICRRTVWAGGVIIGILLMGNGVLLSHPELENAALPMVMLLKEYGKFGFYLSSGVLYLAVITTLIAVMGGMRMQLQNWGKHPEILSGLLIMIFALAGFNRIISVAYPAIGLASLAFFRTKKRGRLIQPPGCIPE